jgi:Flp pilus assembly protein TadG
MKYSIFSALRDFWHHQQSGSALVLASAVVPGVIAVAGLSIDVGNAYVAKRQLKGQTQAAALAGAYALSQPNATSSTVTTAVSNWKTANPVSKVTISGTPTPTLSCVTATSSLPSCNGTNPNAVSFTQSGTVPTFFLKAFGVSTMNVSASAVAAKGGGNAKALNIMFIVDATGSMSNTDANCTITGMSNVTRFQCAMYSIQQMLKTMPTSLDKVGLMVFPGTSTQYSPTSHPCSTQPNSVPYYTSNIKYQIGTTMDNTYNNGSGALNTSSAMVQAIGNYTSMTGCVTNKGGQGSYAAEVITKAQTTLGTPAAGTSNVIVHLSDGDYGASLAELNNQSSKLANQCAQAVTAAQAATTAGTTVYSVAYGAPTSGCSTDTGTGARNPCTTMQGIASDPTKFYSSNSTCQISGSANQISQLPSLFQAITTQLTKPRLLAQ